VIQLRGERIALSPFQLVYSLGAGLPTLAKRFRDMIAAWQASRVICDLGHGPSSPSPAENPAPETS